ncbi:hypothetical protein LEP1GSC062_1243 [Leptospira alexanderi serovar Manhao 3 str. L 60]|uniref:Uncharacterized protein n=1 Tax=Leptospira alexanderi serovar Manhao 3 str. L 60 TaxID=1049759 RepID=V6HVU9_9LEPT|nr:hypothetical protein LEP1GSC062_1243 [Leptospira alexanderi serovar Manhao 3 str. L 60]
MDFQSLSQKLRFYSNLPGLETSEFFVEKFRRLIQSFRARRRHNKKEIFHGFKTHSNAILRIRK